VPPPGAGLAADAFAGLADGAALLGVLVERLGLVAMVTVCLLRSSNGQHRWLQEIRAGWATQGGCC
jgi:hypothetical protein